MNEERWWIKIMGDLDGRWLVSDLRNRQLYTVNDRFELFDVVTALVKAKLLTGTGEEVKK